MVIPPTLTPGVYYLFAIADATNKVSEANETNNARGVYIRIY